jgi:hypothetical protein
LKAGDEKFIIKKNTCLAILKENAASLSQSFPNRKQATHHINGFATNSNVKPLIVKIENVS